MATTVELTTTLDCTPDAAWERVGTSALLDHITSPLIRFLPRARPFPERWATGEYRAWMLLFGFVPIGWQAIVISFPEPRGATRFVRDNGYGPLIQRWDHWIEIGPEGGTGRTRYTDRVTIDAGLLTPVIGLFARVFYAHRQKRWRQLVREGFASLPR
ncbi:MAG: hypothetical protein AAGB23_07060 [Pseudomonadota bacterium]